MMRLMLVAGATGVIVLWSWPAEAAQRDENTRAFCQSAPDLCVFVCRGDCSGMSNDYICESRRGRLVVLEGGERSYFEEDFSLCWHRSRPPDEPLPDPEHDYIPGWPGSDEGAMCRKCDRDMRRCREVARNHVDFCIAEHHDIYDHICTRSQQRHGIPRGRNSKEVDTSLSCRIRLQGRGRDRERDRSDGNGSDVREESKKDVECKTEAIAACVEDYRDSHPDDTSEDKWVIGVDKIVKAEYTNGKVVRWGGKVGYEEACEQAGVIIINACVSDRTQCAQDVDPESLCAGSRMDQR